ncbi:hypothetical protein H4R18_002245 [Coemansia javaensis]|uniref:Ubiquinol-cytochrome-c reductase complex assembly factor 2 n=1 Tax=Coemansia javaensis TaxID=2761396 RepID=A0A9W8HDH8_9FUNG|nr:hypothetical protein H4R18_002245 [Coemansia javaensis]
MQQRFGGRLGELYAAYAQVVQRWPADKLRPGHCYKKVLRQHMDAKFDRLSTMHGPALDGELARARREVDALQSLVAGEYRARFKAPESLTSPRSQPDYYRKLLASIDAAAASGKSSSLRVD